MPERRNRFAVVGRIGARDLACGRSNKCEQIVSQSQRDEERQFELACTANKKWFAALRTLTQGFLANPKWKCLQRYGIHCAFAFHFKTRRFILGFFASDSLAVAHFHR